MRDFTAELLSEGHNDVSIEPELQNVTGERLEQASTNVNNARVDVAARGFWVRGQMAYFDIKVFNPTAKVYLNQSLKAAHKSNEQAKKRSYNKRINHIDQGTFTPLVFICFDGIARECSTFFNRLAEKIADKRNVPISKMKNWIRTRINFHLLRCQILCLRGSRSIRRPEIPAVVDTDVSLVVEEGKIYV